MNDANTKIAGSFHLIGICFDDDMGELTMMRVHLPEGVEMDDAVCRGDPIAEAEIRDWFDLARGRTLPPPTNDEVARLTYDLNLVRVTHDGFTLKPDWAATYARVQRALETLTANLPPLLTATYKANDLRLDSPFETTDQLATAERLQAAVADAQSMFDFWGPDKRHELWHHLAEYVAVSARLYWRPSGRRIGFGRETSPAVIVATHAVNRLYRSHDASNGISPEAVAKALTRRRQKRPVPEDRAERGASISLTVTAKTDN